MRTNILSFSADLQYPLEKYGNPEEILFFDIETTGFSATSSFVYLIGCVTYQEKEQVFQATQWFAENKEEEMLLLHTFFSFALQYKTLLHYNGQGFDMPYLTKKCKSYNLPYRFTDFQSVDLYRHIAPYKKLLKLPQLKQRAIEEYLDIYREDPFTGGQLIAVYEAYTKNPQEAHYQALIQHNLDDLCCMVRILPILSYGDLFRGAFTVESVTQIKGERPDSDSEVLFEIRPASQLPKRFSFGNAEFYFTGFKNRCKLKVHLYDGELKYFYPNYKDYFYLPAEDISIHKSVAFYVDKNFRRQAKAADCYIRKTSHFLPQYQEIVLPSFKNAYKDRKTYFELTESFTKDPKLLRDYVLHIFLQLSR